MTATADFLARYRPAAHQPSAGDLCREVPSITAAEPNERVMDLFNRHRDLAGLPVVEEGRPIGLINRSIFLSQMSKPFRIELYGRKSCIAFMDKEPLVVEAGLDIETLAFRAVAHGEKALADGFIVTRDGCFAGMATGLDLMRAVADLQASRHRQLMHSIEYASVIQQSTLRGSRDVLSQVCGDADLVWAPRDVVGGDFYQFSAHEDGWFGIVADCTGHGVPGAFMTLIASSSLTRAVEQHGPRAPGHLLASINRSIKQMLGQFDGPQETPRSDDGMDAAAFWYAPDRRRLVFAGARLGLFIVRPGVDEAEHVDGQRAGVGYVDSAADYAWTDHAIDLPAGSLVFVTTDGLIDQIGGSRGIAFGKRRLREVLALHRDAPARTVNAAMAEALQQWQGGHQRRDDLTFFCFRT